MVYRVLDIDLSTLSAIESKASRLAKETYFREAYSDLASWIDVPYLCQRTLALTLKPETLVSRQVETVLEYLFHHGFEPFLAHYGIHSRCAIREIWRYQWNIATLERLELMERLMCSWGSIWILAWDVSQPPNENLTLPATARFCELKGSALAHEHEAGQLRPLLRGGNRILTFVHAADEPFDIIRELGILFDRRHRRMIVERWLTYVESGNRSLEDLDDFLANDVEYPIHDLELQSAANRLMGWAQDRRHYGLVDMIEQAIAGRYIPLDTMFDILDEENDPLLIWDALVIGTNCILHDFPGAVCEIEADGVIEWKEGLGRVVGPDSNVLLTP